MINETIYTQLVLATCTDLFDIANDVAWRAGLYQGLAIGLIIGFMMFLGWFMVIRRDIQKEGFSGT